VITLPLLGHVEFGGVSCVTTDRKFVVYEGGAGAQMEEGYKRYA
jgi:hypothetical protein